MSDMLRSERELARRHRVGRITVRRALKRLVSEGYLVSRPRQGYALAAGAGRATAGGLIAYVHGTSRAPWSWSEYQMHLQHEFQRLAGEAGRDLLVVALESAAPEELGRRLAERAVQGAIVDSDAPAVTGAVRAAGVPVVQVDAAAPESDAVTQDNFGGAYRATMYLIERGHRRIAFLGYNHYQDAHFLHVRERLGGYLAALGCSNLPAPEAWRLVSPPVESPGRALVELARKEDGPTAAAVLWPELLPEVGRALAESGAKLELAVWWGGAPGARERWRAEFPGLALPAGVAWSPAELARTALARLGELMSGGGLPPGRMLVPAEFVPGEASPVGPDGRVSG
jgi:DNA-binding LacI/PurR family transcriptional regulator